MIKEYEILTTNLQSPVIYLPRLLIKGDRVNTRKILYSVILAATLSACGGGGGSQSCVLNSDCTSGTDYCKFADSCGSSGQEGTCTAIPTTCDPAVANVCTCESLTFFNECFAAQAGQSVASAGQCS